MIYANFEYYVENYGGNMLSEDNFNFYARRASSYINLLTFNRLKELKEDEIQDEVKLCTCELAEMLSNIKDKDIEITSESSDGFSVSFDLERGNDAVCDVIKRHLLHTGLLYRGF